MKQSEQGPPAVTESRLGEQALVAGAPPTMGHRFPATSRLLKHADFDRVYKQGQRQFSTNLTVFYLRRAGIGGPRVGFTVSKALGGAVDRNRMKRRLREAVRKQLNLLKSPMDVVINPKRTLLRAEFTQIAAEIERAFSVVEKRSATMKTVETNSQAAVQSPGGTAWTNRKTACPRTSKDPGREETGREKK